MQLKNIPDVLGKDHCEEQEKYFAITNSAIIWLPRELSLGSKGYKLVPCEEQNITVLSQHS